MATLRLPLSDAIVDYIAVLIDNTLRGLSSKTVITPHGFKKITVYRVGSIVRVDLQPEEPEEGDKQNA